MTRFASWRRDRLAGAALALLVQAGFIALLIFSHSPPAPPEKRTRELIFVLPRLPKTIEPPPRAAGKPSPGQTATPTPLLAPPPLIGPGPTAPSPEDLRNLGQSIFGCAPENYSSLTPQQRALCPRPGEGVVVQSAPNLMGTPDHLKDEAYWDAELARKKSPTWLPCVGFLSVSPLCLAYMTSKGTLTNPRKWPIYETKKYPPWEFYKAEQFYDAWVKAHPKQAAAAAAQSIAANQ